MGRRTRLREHALPSNPNCVAFATDARALFGGRSWVDLQRLAAAVVGPFHEESQLPALAGFAWRVALDRRNERHTHGVLYVLFDGPATSAQLDRLELAAGELAVGFGQPSVERAPSTGAPAVYAFGGRVHAVWSGTADQPQLRCLSYRDGRVHNEVVERGSSALAAPELPEVLGTPAPYSEAERELERMRIAFALKWIGAIVAADGEVRPEEAKFVEGLFPTDLLVRLGLEDARVREEYYEAAAEALPVQLGHHDKLALVGLFFSACCSDGALDAREFRALREGGERLGLTREQVVKYLRRFW